MSLVAQLLRLCAVSVLGWGVMVAVHGLRPPPPIASEELAVCSPPPEDVGGATTGWITPSEARALAGDEQVAFVDCRPREAFEQGHVTGSLHLPDEDDPRWDGLIKRLRDARTVITYCTGACDRSSQMALRFREAGITDVRVLTGGMPEWLDQGYPAQSGTCQHCDSRN